MRLSLRLILLLVIGVTVVTFLVARNQVRAEKRGLRDDLQRRSEILADSLQELVEPALGNGRHSQLELRRIVERFGNRERLAGIAVYDLTGKLLAESPGLTERLNPPAPPIAAHQERPVRRRIRQSRRDSDARVLLPLHNNGAVVGVLAVFHDATYIYAAKRSHLARTDVARDCGSAADRVRDGAHYPLDDRGADFKDDPMDEGAAQAEGKSPRRAEAFQ